MDWENENVRNGIKRLIKEWRRSLEHDKTGLDIQGLDPISLQRYMKFGYYANESSF
jgi:hypothetical protein